MPTRKRDTRPETTELNVSHEMLNRKSGPAFIPRAPRTVPVSRSFPFFSSYATNRLELNVRDWGEERLFVLHLSFSFYRLFPSPSFSPRLTPSLFRGHLALKRHALFNQHKPPPLLPSPPPPPRDRSLYHVHPSYLPLQLKV